MKFFKKIERFIKLLSGDTCSAKGIHQFSLCEVITKKAQMLEKAIEEHIKLRPWALREGKKQWHWDEYQSMIYDLQAGFLTQQELVHNVTTTAGRAVLAQRLGGDTTYTGTVNYTALGTDNTAASVADATLGTESYRKALSSGTDSNNISYIETFFTASEVNGTFEEYGMFIDGTASADTGQLFNRFTTTVTKSSVETLNVQSIITINDA